LVAFRKKSFLLIANLIIRMKKKEKNAKNPNKTSDLMF